MEARNGRREFWDLAPSCVSALSGSYEDVTETERHLVGGPPGLPGSPPPFAPLSFCHKSFKRCPYLTAQWYPISTGPSCYTAPHHHCLLSSICESIPPPHFKRHRMLAYASNASSEKAEIGGFLGCAGQPA